MPSTSQDAHPQHTPKIGVFDSGVGGVSVLCALRARLPQCPLWYAADSGYAPYGPQSRDYILARSRILCDGLLAQGVDAIVIACNTATTQAAGSLRALYPQLPIIGIEPAVRPAALQSPTGRIAVLATDATLASARLAQLQDELKAQHPQVQWFNYAPSGLAKAIEEQDHSTIAQEVSAAAQWVIAQQCDTVVLGCTHYPLVMPLWQQAMPNVRYLDPAKAVAQRTAHVLHVRDLAPQLPASAGGAPSTHAALHLYSTGSDSARLTLERLVAQHVL